VPGPLQNRGENQFHNSDQNRPETDELATKAVMPGQKTAASATATPTIPRILAARLSITPAPNRFILLSTATSATSARQGLGRNENHIQDAPKHDVEGTKTVAIPNANAKRPLRISFHQLRCSPES
jgi:hypothetical protein